MAFIAVAVPVLWGAQCDPPPPACDTGGCAADEISECVLVCAVPRLDRQACDVNPCAGSVCDYGLRCVGGMCQPSTNLNVFYCQAGTPCATGNYCRLFGPSFPGPGNVPPDPTMPGNPFDGQCVTPAVEGGACTSGWAPESPDVVCEAGTDCLADPRGPAGALACFRSCLDAGDCACTSSDPAVLDDCVLAPPATGVATICAHCVANRSTCGPGEWGCCDSAATCGAVAGSGSQCCRATGVSCSANGECCTNSVCGAPLTGGRACAVCPVRGGMPNMAVGGTGCCAPLVPRPVGGNTVCAESCPPPGAPATCAPPACPTNPGRWSCTTASAVCAEVRSAEVCDGIDNNCDGSVDNLAPTTCSGPVLPSGSFLGCPGLDLPGVRQCRSVGGAITEVCNVTSGYCAVDSLGNRIDEAPTGGSSPSCFTLLDPCSTSMVCSPAEACCGDGMGGTRCGILEDGAAENLCWLPGARSTLAGCPGTGEPGGCVGLMCGACLLSNDCGWCGPGSGNFCVPGTAAGPTGGECSPLNWFTDPTNPPSGC